MFAQSGYLFAIAFSRSSNIVTHEMYTFFSEYVNTLVSIYSFRFAKINIFKHIFRCMTSNCVEIAMKSLFLWRIKLISALGGFICLLYGMAIYLLRQINGISFTWNMIAVRTLLGRESKSIQSDSAKKQLQNTIDVTKSKGHTVLQLFNFLYCYMQDRLE